jgi:hypothetical protein
MKSKLQIDTQELNLQIWHSIKIDDIDNFLWWVMCVCVYIYIYVWDNLPCEWSHKEAHLSHLETGMVTWNLKACVRLPESEYGVV